MLLHVCSYLRRLVITTILILHIRNILLSFSSHLFAFNHTHYITLRALILLLTCVLSVTKVTNFSFYPFLPSFFSYWVYKYTCFPPIYNMFSFDVSVHIVTDYVLYFSHFPSFHISASSRKIYLLV